MKRVLLTGTSGQVGGALQSALRSYGDILAPARTELDLFCGFSDAGNDIIEDRFFDHQPRASAATLAVVEENGVGCAFNGGFEIGRIAEDDVGRLAAEFEADLLEVARCGAHNDFSDFGGAGK